MRTRSRSGTPAALRRVRDRIIREGVARVCGLCGLPIDVTLPRTHPGSLELDHIVPRVYGGGDELTNIRPTHRRCNRQRGKGRRNPRTIDGRSATW